MSLLALKADSYASAANGSLSTSTFLVIVLVVWLFVVVAFWRVFTKAGKPGWYAIIPIVNTWVLLKIGGKPGWWLLLLWIPIVNVVLLILAYHGISRNFGHDAGFTVGLVFLPIIFFPILGYGTSHYRGGYYPNVPGSPVGSGDPWLAQAPRQH